MPFQPIALPPIPEDTARAARYLFGKGNIYIRLGEHINDLLAELEPAKVEIHGKRSREVDTRYALMTAFQYAEEFTDDQMVEAVRNRVDLKYALHLPMYYPSFDPLALCEFHQRLYEDPSSRLIYQVLIGRLTQFDLLKTAQDQTLLAHQVLETVCTSTRIERVVEAMFQALEALTITNSEWLRQVTLPHWYERYSRRRRISFWPNGKGEWKVMTLELGGDIQYLLGEVERSHQPAVVTLREVQLLRQMWEEQFEVSADETSPARVMGWRLTGCASCIRG